MKRSLFLSLLLAAFVWSHAGTVDTLSIYSAAMRKSIKCVVIKPDSYRNNKLRFPTVYLLHGHGGAYNNWVNRVPDLKAHADTYQVLIVCPDGAVNSWYFDSPADTTMKYESFVGLEVPAYIEAKYRTVRDRHARAITGLSMGGHGALYLAFRHQDVYGAAGSMSGGVDIRPFPNNWDMAKRLGRFSEKPDNWEKNTVVNLLYLLTPNALSLLIDCGSEDFFYKVNVSLHQKLLERNIPHDFISRPGGHNWPYWNNAIKYQLLFMNGYFNKYP